MHRIVRGLLIASAYHFLAIAPAILAPSSAQAQPADISFDSFHDQLGNYGDWLYSDRWGEVWRPWQQDQNSDWRPYSVGHWAYTSEYGWTWISDEGPWGDIAYHYGRWVFDPDDGWLWLTGYVWSPAWVVWRSAGANVGWMPMPPDDGFLGAGGPGVSVSSNFGDWGDTSGFYGYARWYGPQFDENRFGTLWTFVPSAHFADPVYRTYAVPRPQVVTIIRVSRNVTNYTIVNNVIINRSVNITLVQGAGGRPIVPVHAAAVLHNTRWIAPVNSGQQVQAQMRQIHPRGNGTANSAPKPTAQQVGGLSTRSVPARGPAGGGDHHLFNRANAAQVQTGKPTPNMPVQADRSREPDAGPEPQRLPAPPAAQQPQRPSREGVSGEKSALPANHPSQNPAMRENIRPSREQPEKTNSPPPRPSPDQARPAHPEMTRKEPPHRAAPPPKSAPARPVDHAAPKPERDDRHPETDH